MKTLLKTALVATLALLTVGVDLAQAQVFVVRPAYRPYARYGYAAPVYAVPPPPPPMVLVPAPAPMMIAPAPVVVAPAPVVVVRPRRWHRRGHRW